MILDKHVAVDGKVTLWDLGDGVDEPRQITLHQIDAAHALSVEPDRYKLELDEPEPEPAPDPITD